MAKRNFFAELKRRNVYKVAVAYAVVGWLVMQVAATIVPALHLPDSLTTAVVVVTLLGFPIALAIAWAFEITPEGMKRTEDISPNEYIPQWSRRKFALFLVPIAVLAAALLAYQFLRPEPVANSPTRIRSVTAIPEKSIAVLPLVNASNDKDEQYFSDGLSEDLITALSQFASLKVIGRNSSFQFRDSKDDSRTIGAKLGVAHLLEGSVQRSGDEIRISAELVNAADGSTLWSQHYDRPYKDLFKLQDDITAAVADALKTKLLNASGAPTQSDRPPSGDLPAYNAFLQGQFYSQRNNEADYRKAIEFFETAVRLDPKYARAYAALANAENFLTEFVSGAQTQQAFAAARIAVNKALDLDPNLAAAHGARGLLLIFADIDLAGAEAEFKQAVKLAPNDLDLRASLAEVRASLGHPEAAIEPIRLALAADPRSDGWYNLLVDDLMAIGRLGEAERVTQEQMSLQTSASAQAGLSSVEALRGNAAAALAKAEQMPPGKSRDFALANARQIGNDTVAADAALKALIDKYGKTDPYLIARCYALRRDPDGIFAWLDRAWAERDNNITILYYDPFLLRYKDDPRFAALCKKMGLPTPAELAAAPKA
jgi:TolB-like protein/Flp pilus assembly protein TadD